ncbi:MAG: hypothetical protein IPJ65_12635 [Archangiaceae bacterium]|nr:hypothetical protein [Archangiaceae bacterium]
MRALPCCVVVSLVACSSQTPGDGGIVGQPCAPKQIVDTTRLPLVEVEVPYRGTVGSGALPTCGTPRIESSLVDEENLPVSDATFTLRVTDAGEPVADLSFTPHSAGPFHFVVQFEPSLRRVQGDLIAGRRGARAPLETLPLPSNLTLCQWPHQLPSGTLMCTDDRRGLLAIRGGQVVQTLSDRNAVPKYAADVAWVNTLSRLERWVETDAGLVLEQSYSGASSNEVLAVSRTVAYGASFVGVTRLRVDGGTLEADGFAVPRTLSAVRGDIVDSSAPGSLSADGGQWWWAGDVACLNPIVPDAGQRCFAGTGFGVWAEPGGAWFATDGQLGVVAENGAIASLPLPRGFLVTFGPLLHADPSHWVLAARDADAGLHYEILEGTFTSGWLDADRIYLFAPGELRVLPR